MVMAMMRERHSHPDREKEREIEGAFDIAKLILRVVDLIINK